MVVMVGLGESFHVVEDAPVNRVQDGVGPETPIPSGPHVVLIPGGAFEFCAAIGQRDQAEFAAF